MRPSYLVRRPCALGALGDLIEAFGEPGGVDVGDGAPSVDG
jgi:hypothetical protein